MESLGGRKVLKPSEEFLFLLFFRFLGKSTSEKTIEPKKAGFDAAMVSLGGRKVQKPSVDFFLNFLFRILS